MDSKTNVTGTARAALAGQEGMTLLEIMIVLAIIALVMGFLVGPRIMAAFSESKVDVAGMEVREYAHQAYPQWAQANPGKQCPQQLSELSKYMNKQDTKDPWDNQFIMLCGENAPQEAPNKFGVVSKGPDGKLDTTDDVKSWEQKK